MTAKLITAALVLAAFAGPAAGAHTGGHALIGSVTTAHTLTAALTANADGSGAGAATMTSATAHRIVIIDCVFVQHRTGGLSIWKFSGTEPATGQPVHFSLAVYENSGSDAWAASTVANSTPCGGPVNLATGIGRFVEVPL